MYRSSYKPYRTFHSQQRSPSDCQLFDHFHNLDERWRDLTLFHTEDLQTIWMSSSTGATAWNEKDYIHIRKSTETDQVPSHQETGSEFLDEEIELFMWRIKLRELHEN